MLYGLCGASACHTKGALCLYGAGGIAMMFCKVADFIRYLWWKERTSCTIMMEYEVWVDVNIASLGQSIYA